MKNKWIKRVSKILLTTVVTFALAGCGSAQPVTDSAVKGGATVNEIMTQVNQMIDQLAADAGLAPLSVDVNLKPVGALDNVQNAAKFADGKAVFLY